MLSRRTGFTIIELMITVVVIAVLATVAAPGLRDLVLNARMTGIANNLMTDLAVARSEAVKRSSRTALCPSNKAAQCSVAPYAGCECTNTPWNQGWLIFQDSDGNGEVSTASIATDLIKYVPAIDGVNETLPNTIKVPVGTQTTATAPFLRFNPSGMLGAAGAATAVFHLCDARSLVHGTPEPAARGKGRRVTITPSGRAGVTRCTCDDGECVP